MLGWISSLELRWSFRRLQSDSVIFVGPFQLWVFSMAIHVLLWQALYCYDRGAFREPAVFKCHMSPQYAVVKIVREKYLKTTAFETQEQFQAFLSELYVYLVDQMHIALNQVGRNTSWDG